MAQPSGVLLLNDETHVFLERQYTRGLLPEAFLTSQPLSAREAQRYLDTLALAADQLSPTDRAILARLRYEAPAPGQRQAQRMVPFLYGNGHDLISVETDDYRLQANLIAYYAVGSAWQRGRPDLSTRQTTWTNLRGVRIAGAIGAGFFFEARIEEVQERAAQPQIEKATIPRERLTSFLSGGADAEVSSAYDYNRSMGLVGYQSKHFEVRFGRDRNRWGTGLTSLWLSNYAPVYDQLQIRTTFWRIQLVNLYTAMEDLFASRGAATPRKYGSFTHLTVQLPARLQAEAFQAMIFIPDTTRDGRRPGFDPAFLNPLLLYQQPGRDIDKLGNYNVGAGLSWLARDGLQLYTQLLLTEFEAKELFSSRRWWGNKWAFLAGVHATNLLPQLDLRLEYSRVRPYTYSHHGSSNYLHYDDFLGHPGGQNLEEIALFLKYHPAPRWQAHVNAAFTRRGRDTPSENYGGDPRRSYDDRVQDFDVQLLQGVRRNEVLFESHVSYEWFPRFHVEGRLFLSMSDDASDGLRRVVEPSLVIRWGVPALLQSRRY